MPIKSSGFWTDLDEELEDLKEKQLYRSLLVISRQNGLFIEINGISYTNFASNNYLGLATHPSVVYKAAEAAKKWGAGSGASRLITGNLEIHQKLEEKISSFKHEESALVFSSGYLANLGAVTALLDDRDLVLCDRLNHASLIDAARSSRAKFLVYPHRDVSALKKILQKSKNYHRRLVISDAYFSMDGHVAPLPELLKVCEETESLLMIDEAHSTGVYGKSGSGLAEHFGLSGKIPVVMGTLSKALGSVGGFIAGNATLREILINKAKTFIYTTGPSPSASAAALAAIEQIQAEPALRKKLWSNTHFLRDGIKALGWDLADSEGPIIPIIVKDTSKAFTMQEAFKKDRLYVSVIRPPTVPKNTQRLRLSVSASHTQQDLEKVLTVLKKFKKVQR